MISPASGVKALKAEMCAARDNVKSEPEVSQITRFTVLSKVDENVCLYPKSLNRPISPQMKTGLMLFTVNQDDHVRLAINHLHNAGLSVFR